MSGTNPNFNAMYEEAQKMYSSTHTQIKIKSISIFKELIDLNPAHLESYLNLADLYKSFGDYDMSLNTLDLALKNIGPTPAIIESKIQVLKVIHKMDYSAPYYIDVKKADNPFHLIKYKNNPFELRQELLCLVDELINMYSETNKKHDLGTLKKEVLKKVKPIEVDIKVQMDWHKTQMDYMYLVSPDKKDEVIKELERKLDYKLFNVYKNHNKVDKAIEHYDKSKKDKPEKEKYKTKLTLLNEAGRVKEAEDLLFKIFEGKELKLEDRFFFFPAIQDDLNHIHIMKQRGIEFISWHSNSEDEINATNTLKGINNVLDKLDEIEFPSAELYSKTDVFPLLGVVFGSILKQEFKWDWLLGKDIKNGVYGLVIASPDHKWGILVCEYLKQCQDKNNNEYLEVIDFLENKQKLSPKLPAIIGDWKRQMQFVDIK